MINRRYITQESWGDSADLISENWVLDIAEYMYETDTGAVRIGDGSTAYSNLPRFYAENSDIDGGSL